VYGNDQHIEVAFMVTFTFDLLIHKAIGFGISENIELSHTNQLVLETVDISNTKYIYTL